MTLLKRLSVLGVALSLSFTSIAQIAPKDVAMEKFDIETFNSNKVGHDWSYILPDGTEVWQWENTGKGYQVETTPAHSAYTTIKLFNYEGHLVNVWFELHGFLIGKSKQYDGSGNVIKEYDHDTDFAFSVDDLIKKMKDEYHVDITDTRQVFTVYRGAGDIGGQDMAIYGVYVYDYSGGRTETSHTIAYLFDGNTGELLYTLPADIEGSPDIMLEYERMMLRKKENNQ